MNTASLDRILVLAVLLATPWGVAEAQLEPVLTGLNNPVYVTGARDGTNRLFIVDRLTTGNLRP